MTYFGCQCFQISFAPLQAACGVKRLQTILQSGSSQNLASAPQSCDYDRLQSLFQKTGIKNKSPRKGTETPFLF